jgi:hypothetical protein
MPGSIVERDELLDRAVTTYQKMRGDAQRGALAEFDMGVCRQISSEQPCDPRAAEFPGRQTDAMEHDQIGNDTRGTLVEKW